MLVTQPKSHHSIYLTYLYNSVSAHARPLQGGGSVSREDLKHWSDEDDDDDNDDDTCKQLLSGTCGCSCFRLYDNNRPYGARQIITTRCQTWGWFSAHFCRRHRPNYDTASTFFFLFSLKKTPSSSVCLPRSPTRGGPRRPADHHCEPSHSCKTTAACTTTKLCAHFLAQAFHICREKRS